MLDQIRSFLNGLGSDSANPPGATSDRETAIATAALLVHCAKADGHESASETARLSSILTEELSLSADEARTIREIADEKEREAIDIHRFTRVLHANLDREGRMRVVSWLWQVAKADGQIDGDESNTVDLAARLLDVEVRDRVALRRAIDGSEKSD